MLNIKVLTKEVERLFNKINKNTANLRPLYAQFYGIVHKEVMLNFRKQGATADIFKGEPSNTRTKWAALSSLTKAHRLARGATKIGTALEASGGMKFSIGTTVRNITNNGLEYGTTNSLSAVHHFGKTIRPVKAKVLAIPYPGVVGRPRQYSNTFIAKKTIFQKNDDGTIKPLFFFKDQITIPPRPHMTIPESSITRMRVLAVEYLERGLSKR